MRKARFTEEQMVPIIREADREPVSVVGKWHGISEQTIYYGASVSVTFRRTTSGA
jgi:putative transposase